MKIFHIKCFLPLALLVSLSSCMSLGINFGHKTPKRASKLPHFDRADSLIGTNNNRRDCFDVTHYGIHLTIDPTKKSIQGHVQTSFTLKYPTSEIQLDLDPKLQIDSIVGKTALKFRREKTAIFISLNSADQKQTISVYYHGVPKAANRPPWQGGFVWKQDKAGKPFIGIACEGDGAYLWLPIKTWLGDEPDSADLYFTVPEGLTAVSNGVLQSKKVADAKTTFHWKTRYNVNPYNLTVYVGDYQLLERPFKSITGQTILQQFFVLPENLEKAKTHFLQTDSILSCYENLFGPYPWQSESYKLIESPYEGMEHQTAIAYGHGYKNERNENFDYIILHESAHEWWGNSVSVADFSDVWIHEGIATYAEALYVERTRGYKAYLNYMDYIQLSVVNRKPIIGPKAVYYWNYKDADVYMKGAAMLHALRTQLRNDTVFFSILKEFYQAHTRSLATTEAFIDLVNKKTGVDYTYFFEQYLFRRDSPHLKWNFDYDKNLQASQLVYRLERVNKNFRLAVKVKQGDQVFFIYPSSKLQFYTLPFPSHEGVDMNEDHVYLQDGYKKQERVKTK